MRELRLPDGTKNDPVRPQSQQHHDQQDEDIRLTPVLLIKRQEYCQRVPLSFPSIPPLLLWCWGLMLSTYPLWVILLQKYRADFQDDWNQQYYYRQPPNDGMMSSSLSVPMTSTIAHGGGILPIILDVLTVWVLDVSPRIAASVILFHSSICIAYYLRYASSDG